MTLIQRAGLLTTLLDEWQEVNDTNPVPVLTKLCELFEEEITSFISLDPDPFDDKYTDINDPNCVIAHILRTLHKNEEFINKLVTSYMFNSENNYELNCVASRLLLNIIPGMNETDILQDMESQVGKLLDWATMEKEPLRTFACGLLSKAMMIPDCPDMFKERNAELVPMLIKRLKCLAEVQNQNMFCIDDVSQIDKSLKTNKAKRKSIRGEYGEAGTPKTPGSASRKRKLLSRRSTAPAMEYNKPRISLHPLTVCGQQKIALHYLGVMGEYQDFLGTAFELNVLDLIFYYINIKHQQDATLACNALLYLSSLLCHKKFVIEFVSRGGIQRILEIPQPSIVSTMSSLCLYYIAHNEDAVERLCLLPAAVLQRLVEYLLWLLECAHVSGRCHSALFFSFTFSFNKILTLFESMDGLRKLYNMISTLKIMRVEESELMTDNSAFLEREMSKNAALTLKKYFSACVVDIYHNLRRNVARENDLVPPPPTPAYKSMFSPSEDIQEYIDYMHENYFDIAYFEKKELNLSIIKLFLKLITLAATWKSYSNRIDVIVTSLETLVAMSLARRMNLSFCQQIEVASNDTQSGIKILLRAVEGDLVQDISIQKSALRVLCNCVYHVESPDHPLEETSVQVLQKIWSTVRLNNGIKILMSALDTTTPITEADAVRTLSCKALCGLSSCDLIRQVLGKLPLFQNENFRALMKEPVLSDQINEHARLKKYAAILIKRVTGKSLHVQQSTAMPMMSALNKADIVAQTKITYPQKELLTIIHKHLKSQGLSDAAEALKVEAGLPDEPVPPPKTPAPSLSKTVLKVFTTPLLQQRTLFPTPLSEHKHLTSRRNSVIATPPTEIVHQEHPSPCEPSLDSIVTGYLREQHAKCSNPVATCPPFSLLRAHSCPEPRYRRHASYNMTKRVLARQTTPSYGGIHGRKHNRRYLYSKFRSTACFKDMEADCLFTCCAWMDNDKIFLGTQTGDVKLMSYNYDHEESLHSCHGAPISTCFVSKNGRFLSTSAPFGAPLAAVWKIVEGDGPNNPTSLEVKMEITEDSLLQFSNSDERVIGTDDATAHIYELGTGQLLRTFYDERNCSYYSKNFACFSPDDDLVLSDGCLWDVRAKRFIHKFDKFNNFVSGVFNPNGLEIIINSEVWDIRTFHLLTTCSSLDQCRVVFNNGGDVIYGIKHSTKSELVIEQSGMLGPYESAFRTFDACDYTSIGTVDVRKSIYDISSTPSDQVVAVIESSGSISSMDMDTGCRFYDVGRTKGLNDSDDEEDEDESKADSELGNEEELAFSQLFSNIFSGDDDDDDDDDGDDIIDDVDDVTNDDDDVTDDVDDDDEYVTEEEMTFDEGEFTMSDEDD